MKGQHKGNKKSVADVLVMTNDGNIVNIESQIKKQAKFHKRTHFYDSRLNSLFLSAGENYNELPLVITINILGFNLHPLEKYHTTFKLTETTYKEYILDDVIETHNINLVKFRKKLRNGKFDLNDPEDRITLLFDVKSPQNLIEKVIEMDEFAKNIYEKTLHILKDKQEYISYIRADQAERDKKGMIKYAEKEGKKQGIKEGIEEEKIAIATNLKNKGISLEIISQTTNLPLSKIKKL